MAAVTVIHTIVIAEAPPFLQYGLSADSLTRDRPRSGRLSGARSRALCWVVNRDCHGAVHQLDHFACSRIIYIICIIRVRPEVCAAFPGEEVKIVDVAKI